MADEVSTLALRVDSQTAISNLKEFGLAASHLGGVTDVLKAKLLQLNASFLSTSFAKSLVNDAAEGQEALGKFETVLGRFQEKASRVVDELVAKFNFDTASAQGAISGMVDTFAKAGMSIEDALDMATSLNKRAADLEAFTNAQGGVAHVAEQLTSGVLGNAMSVRNLGIVMSDELIKAQMLKEKTEGLTFANERAAKMHARVSLMLQQSASAEGQVSRETDNYSNRVRYLNARIADLRGSLGDALIPTFTQIVQGTAKIVDTVNNLSPAMKSTIVGVGALTGTFVTLSPFLTKLFLGFKQLSATQALTNAVSGETTRIVNANTTATSLETNAVNQETIAETKSASTSQAVVLTKREEATARLSNAKAIQLETKRRLAAKHGFRLDSENKLIRDSKGKVVRFTGQTALTSKAIQATNKGFTGTATANALGTLLTPLKGLNNVFTSIASKLPLATRFGASFTRFLGVLGTGTAVIGGIIGAFELFKNAPQWLEIAFDKVPSIFSNLGKRTIDAAKGLTTNAVSYGKDLIVKGTLGFAQTAKRLAGFETEASRAYKLNKQIEENNKRRQELLEQEQRQRQSENAMLQSQKTAQDSSRLSKLSYTESKENDSVKLEKAISQRDTYQRQINGTLHQIEKLRTDASGKNVSQEQREIAAEEIKKLSDSLEDLNEQWRKSAEECDKLSESVSNASRSFEEDQKGFNKTKESNEKDFANTQLQTNLDNATNHSERLTALNAMANNAKKEYEATGIAQQNADALNEQSQKIQEQLTSKLANKALMTLQELAESGDFESEDAITKWSGALVGLERAGYKIPENEQILGQGSAQQLYSKMTQLRKDQEQELTDTLTKRDEEQSIANERSSRFSAMNAANKAVNDENEQYNEAIKQREKQDADKQEERNKNRANFQQQVNDTYFDRQLRAADQYYGDDKLGATQYRYSMIGSRGEEQWSQSVQQLTQMEKQLGDYDKQLSVYALKEKNGTLTDSDIKAREELQAKRDKLESEYDSEYQSAIQKRLATEDELLGLENSMRDEYLSEAQKYVDEQTNSMKEQMLSDAQAEEEEQKHRLEERSKVEEEARQAVSGQRAITAGSSEAFNIASKIYNRGQEDLPPEKKIEKSTTKIEEYVKAMQEQMMAYYAEQANGLTLRMEY